MTIAHERYLRYYLKFAQQHKDDNSAIESEYAQLQRVGEILSTSLTLDDPTMREQWILDYINALDHFLERRGLWSENVRWAERGLAAAQALGREVLVGRFLHDIGWCYRHLGQPQTALKYLTQALTVRQQAGPRAGEATTLDSDPAS
jgi:tetratricopeptide (TPR) repeat protein